MEKKELGTKSKKGTKPARTFRHGAIAAHVWLRQSQTGFVYYDYSISRSWKSTNAGKEGYSQNFFPDNKDAMVACVSEASQWIADTMANAETVVLDAA